MRGLSIETPEGPFRLAAIRLGKLDNGKLAEFALEGLDARAPQGPVKVGRFALKSLDIANLMRLAGAILRIAAVIRPRSNWPRCCCCSKVPSSRAWSRPTRHRPAGQHRHAEPVMGPVRRADPDAGAPTLKMSGPVDADRSRAVPSLASAGIASTSIAFDLGAAWAEGTRAFALEPVTLEVGSVLAAAASLSVANVPREVFSINPLQVVMMAAQIEAGRLELRLRDIGGVDLAVAQYARTQNVSREAARRALIDNIQRRGMTLASANPDAMAIAGALARFVESRAAP